MKELGFQQLLRYALSGGIGLAALLLTYPKIAYAIGQVNGAREVTLVLGAVVVIGTMIYNIHRALLFPIIFRVVGLITLSWNPKRRLLNLWQPSDQD